MGAMEMPTRIKKGTWNRYNAIPTSRPARPDRVNIGTSLITFIGASLSLDLFAGKRASHGMQRTGSGSACLSIFGFLEGNEKKDPVTKTRSRS